MELSQFQRISFQFYSKSNFIYSNFIQVTNVFRILRVFQDAYNCSEKEDPPYYFFGYMVHLGVVILTIYKLMKHNQAKKPGT